MITGMDEKLTGREELAKLLKPPGVSEDLGSSSVVSMSIACL